MSEPETCPGCARKVPDDATWKRDHAEECGDACWCCAYCWTDGHCEPNPADIAARARAEAFEECARIADGRAIRLRSTREPRLDLAAEAEYVGALIRLGAKP